MFSLIISGGMREIVHSTLKKYKTGFSGCIANVTIATDYTLDLLGEAVAGENIRQCKT